MITWIAAASCLLAVIPAALFVRNLALYRPLSRAGRQESTLLDSHPGAQ